jgi:RNA polymerase primary sigma factor
MTHSTAPRMDPPRRDRTSSKEQGSRREAVLPPHADEIEYVSSPTFEELERKYAGHSIQELCRIDPIDLKIRQVSFHRVEMGVGTYLAELRRTPLLDQHQEYELFRWMNFLKYLASGLLARKRRQSRNAARLLERAEEFRNRIVSANLRLVVSIAKKLVDRHNRLEDLISEGNLPLLRSVEIFDFERGIKFSTYATWAIRNSLFRASPRNRRHAARFASGSENVFLTVEDERNSIQADEQYREEISAALDTLLVDLDERERTIICSRFGYNAERQPHRLREIAERLGISTERVRQLLSRSLRRLRERSECLTLELC